MIEGKINKSLLPLLIHGRLVSCMMDFVNITNSMDLNCSKCPLNVFTAPLLEYAETLKVAGAHEYN